MTNKNKVAAVILGAAVGAALVKFFSLPKEERNDIIQGIKERTSELLEDAENTVEKVEHFMDEFKEKGESAWIDKLYLLKKTFSDLYGSSESKNKYLM